VIRLRTNIIGLITATVRGRIQAARRSHTQEECSPPSTEESKPGHNATCSNARADMVPDLSECSPNGEVMARSCGDVALTILLYRLRARSRPKQITRAKTSRLSEIPPKVKVL
jgi:hypothetical protein